ncbi:MAG: hypothetical protein II374_02250 [Lachnospiraceae bacterium]|nr:hypothetical protein [Lachnospiraceae bacterium]
MDYIDGKEPEDDFTKELDKAVNEVRDNEKWRLEYMTLQMSYQEKYEMGVQDGIERGALESTIALVCKKLKKNKSLSQIADELEEDEAKIKIIYDIAVNENLECNTGAIYDRVMKIYNK